MPPRRSSQKACTLCGVRDDIPEEVRFELEQIGGLEGLCNRVPPVEDLVTISRIHHALSDPVRVKILHLLRVQPLCVCVIKQCVQMADSKLSYHLNILKEIGLIEGQIRKNWIIYRLTNTGKQYVEG
jgi:ArsR family transcriptional regulator